MSVGGLAALGGSTVGKLGQYLYERWLLLRGFLVGLRIAWVSTASAAIGLVLFFIAAPAQDILLEVNYDGLWMNLSSWIGFYGLVIVFWVLPVVVSARWILARLAEGSEHNSQVEPVPDWIRCLVPAVLAALCFLAVLTGQLMALRVSPPFSGNAQEFIAESETSLRKGEQLQACTRSLDTVGCATLVRDVAVAVGTKMVRRNDVPLVALGVCLLLGLWFYFARPAVLARRFTAEAVQRVVMAVAAYVAAATGWSLVAFAVASALPSPPSRLLLLAPLVLLLPAIAWLAWAGRMRLLRFLGTVLGCAGAVVMALAVYGNIEAERKGALGLAHLYLLPFVTAAAAAIALWALSRRSSEQATRLGEALLRLTRARAGPGEGGHRAATVLLVNPIFTFLVVITVALNVLFVWVDAETLTEHWRVNRSSLLPVVLGLPVALFTLLSYASARSRVPLVLIVLVLLGVWNVVWGVFGRDYYAVRTLELSGPPRPFLNEAVEKWAIANDCRLPKRPEDTKEEQPKNKEDAQKSGKKLCPAPIIVSAAGGASRAAFHVTGVLGKLLDGEKFAPLGGHTGIVYSAAFNKDRSLIATASMDRTVRIWDGKSGKLRARLLAHTARVQSAVFGTAASDGDRERLLLVTASWDRTAKVWEIASRKRAAETWDVLAEPTLVRTLPHPADVNSAAFSPDGKLVVTGSDDGKARIWQWQDANAGPRETKAHGHYVYGVAFSPDGNHVVTASWDHTAKVWDVSGPDEIREVRTLPHPADVYSAAFSPKSGDLIVTGAEDGTARIWEWKVNTPAKKLSAHRGLVFGAGFSPDEKYVVTASWDGTAKVWDISGPNDIKVRYTLIGHEGDVNSAAFSLDGKRIVTASDDKTALLWDVETGGRAPWEEDGGTQRILPFGKQLFAISSVSGGSLGAAVTYAALADGQRRTGDMKEPPCNEKSLKDRDWYAAAGKGLEPSRNPTISWKACLQLLVAGDFLSPTVLGLTRDPLPLRSGDRAVLLEQAWEARYHNYTRSKDVAKDAAKGAARDKGTLAEALTAIRREVEKIEKGWLPILLLNGTSVEDGKRIVTSDIDMLVQLHGAIDRVFYDAYDFHKLLAGIGHDAPVYSVAVSTDRSRIVTASEDGTARIWDIATGTLIAEAVGHNARVHNAAFSPDGKRLVTASWDRMARLWDLSDPDRFKTPKELKHDGGVNAAAFSPDGRFIATGSDDRSIRIWETATDRPPVILRSAHESRVFAVAFSPDGKRLVSASWDRTAKVWDLSSPGEIKALLTLTHGSDVNSAQFSRDGKLVVTAADDGKARLWEAETGKMLAELSGHQKDKILYSAAFSDDGKRVVTASWDRTAKVWDISSPGQVKELLTLAHGSDVNSAQFSRDGRLIVTAADDGRVRIWNAETGQPVWMRCTDCDVALSTGITMSARFPVISPTGTFVDLRRKTRNVVDGGYYENFGATTAMELARALKEHWGLEPMVVLVNNDHEVTGLECVSRRRTSQVVASWLWGPLNTVVGTRTARGSHAAVSLCEELAKARKEGGEAEKNASRFAFITVDADKSNEHMTLSVSWWMSKNVQSYLDQQLGRYINDEAFRKIERVRPRDPASPLEGKTPVDAAGG